MEKNNIGLVSAADVFLYPDSKLGPLPTEMHLAMALNNYSSLQIILPSAEKFVQFRVASADFTVEYYQMRAIPVEYNTGDGEKQGGAMVLTDKLEKKPDYATRLAPFKVYDCLLKSPDGRIACADGRAAVYICLKAENGLTAGTYPLKLVAEAENLHYELHLEVRVYNVTVPENTFNFTNWFSEKAIVRMHKVEQNTQAYLAILDKYARVMRRLHQNTFYLQFDEQCVVDREKCLFNFEHLTERIKVFLQRGLVNLEMGVLLDRGNLPNKLPDMYTADFKCALAEDLNFDSLEGYKFTVRFVQALAAYLHKHGWTENIFFHIHDEPDIHYRDENCLQARRRQYYLAASILRKYLPGVEIIEAVDSAAFRGAIDIWVPGTVGYERQKKEFDQLISLGEKVWVYVCCGPEGYWLNRFLDSPLIRNRLLFWGCAKNHLSGFLHWGLNQFPDNMDPFQATSCPNHTGIGTNFPCGDAFIVYPTVNEVNISMRLEAQRRGVEDVALFQLLELKDPFMFRKLLDQAFTNNCTYESDPHKIADLYEQLLQALEQKN